MCDFFLIATSPSCFCCDQGREGAALGVLTILLTPNSRSMIICMCLTFGERDTEGFSVLQYKTTSAR